MLHISSDKNLSSLTEVEKGDIQPNATDVRLDKVFEMYNMMFSIDEDQKIHRHRLEKQPDNEGYFYFQAHTSYEVIMKNIVNIGEGEAGFVITRSTLNRNGLFLTSGLYDSGYNGVIAGMLHNNGGPARIKKGTRIGQFLLFKSETLHLYDGDYGIGKQHDQYIYGSK